MPGIKILNKKNHPFTNKIKVYGISIELILTGFFVLIVLFLAGVYRKQIHIKEKPGKQELSIIKPAK